MPKKGGGGEGGKPVSLPFPFLSLPSPHTYMSVMSALPERTVVVLHAVSTELHAFELIEQSFAVSVRPSFNHPAAQKERRKGEGG